MKQIEAQIMGQTYTLSCPEEAHDTMQQAIGQVDAAMCKIRDAGKIRARDRIAVLAALNIAFDMLQTAHNSHTGTTTQANTSTHEALVHPRMQSLLQRMDDLLAEDGKLL